VVSEASRAPVDELLAMKEQRTPRGGPVVAR
jgi:hypothetical protein